MILKKRSRNSVYFEENRGEEVNDLTV